MANSLEVRAILDLPSTSSATPTIPQKKLSVPTIRKPEGISRELYSLIGPSSTTLVAQLAKPRLKQKPNLNAGSKIKWEWRPFKNGGRTDSLQLKHWVKASTEADVEYPFAKYNVQRPKYNDYSLEEYTTHLEDAKWSKEETDYLMNTVTEYDTRWYVIYDRYEFPGGVARSMEDIKDRYCSICRKLIRSRPWTGDESSKNALLSSFSFDKEREEMRKRYVASLENRTPEQIAEEEALYMEIKRLEQNEKRFKRERDDLLRTIGGIDSGLPDVVEDEMQLTGLSSSELKRSKKKGGDLDTPSTPLLSTPLSRRPTMPPQNTAADRQHCITRTEIPGAATATKAAHQPAYLRSFKLPYPKAAIAQKVTQALAELGVSHARLVMPTQGNVALLEGLLEATSTLVDMKKLVDKAEFDIQVLKTRLGMQGAAKAEETDGDVNAMDMDDGNDADADMDGDADAEGEDGRAQSVVSTRSARSRKHNRRSMSISSVDTSATVSTRAGTKRQRRG
ncbi:SWR1-complex protein 4 [Favolaschia claudopus]|uniref:SWR1-complex protein 4 n=1 Tax=Favolaschia claudopus TaxID=2862362 RepID=A0AAW0E9U5_9AGAR